MPANEMIASIRYKPLLNRKASFLTKLRLALGANPVPHEELPPRNSLPKYPVPLEVERE